MSSTITVANSISDGDYARVEILARHLQSTTGDANFNGRAIWVQRGLVTGVTDTSDDLRAALLMLLVDGVLGFAPPVSGG